MGETAGAIRDTLALLDDPDLWVIKRGVPVFCAHDRKGSDGKTLYKVTDDDIPEIAKLAAQLEKSRGVVGRLTDGHIRTDPNANESSQPQLLGVWRNAREGVHPLDGRPVVLVDEYVRRDKLHIAQERPYRSAEYRPISKRLCGVAMLLRDPALDLGAVLYQDDGEPVYFYSLDATEFYKMPDMPPAAKPAAPEQKPAAPADPLFTPDEEKQFARCYEYMVSKGYMAKNQGGPAIPSGTNGSIPGPVKKEQTVMNQNSDSPEFYALKQSAEESKKELERIKAEREQEKVGRMLDQLERVERYQFDRAAEEKRLLALDDKARQERIAEIKRYHHQLPGGEPIQVYAGSVEGSDAGPMPEATMDKIIQYQRDHKCDWATAEKAVISAK